MERARWKQGEVIILIEEMTSLANVVHEIAWNIHEMAHWKREAQSIEGGISLFCCSSSSEEKLAERERELNCLMSYNRARSGTIQWMWIIEKGWVGAGRFWSTVDTSSNMLPRQLIKSGTLFLILPTASNSPAADRSLFSIWPEKRRTSLHFLGSWLY